MGDRPPALALAQPDRQPQAALRVLRELVGGPAAQERVGVGDVGAGRDVEADDLERRALRLPLEEAGPGLAYASRPRTPSCGRRDVEHDDVGGVVGEHAFHVAGVDGGRPPLDQRPDLPLVVRPRAQLPQLAATLRITASTKATHGDRPQHPAAAGAAGAHHGVTDRERQRCDRDDAQGDRRRLHLRRRSEPGGESVGQAVVAPVADPGDVAVGPDEDGRRARPPRRAPAAPTARRRRRRPSARRTRSARPARRG